jgi:hypothetical protein
VIARRSRHSLTASAPGWYATARLILRQPDRAEDAVQDTLIEAWRDIRDLEAMGAPLFGPLAHGFVWSPDGTALLLTRVDALTPDREVAHALIELIDARFASAPLKLVEADHSMRSVTWQRLVP